MTDYAREGVTEYSPLTPVTGSIPAAPVLKEMCPELLDLLSGRQSFCHLSACPAPS